MLPSDVSSRRSSGVAAGGAARLSPAAGPTSRMYSATPPRSHAASSDSPATAGAAKSSVAAMTVAWRARRPARLIDRRGGPRYGPPASSSEGGYAPLGLPRPSLGRAPAKPWRASGLAQDVSSAHHVVRQRADARHGDGHAILGRQREARFGHEPGARQQIGAGRKQVVADEPGGEVVERAAHGGGRDLALVRDGAAALDHDGDVEDGRLLVVGQPHHGAQRARLAVDLGLRQVQRILALDVA